MVLGSSNADLLNKVVFALVLSGPVFAPGLAFDGTQQKIGNMYFGVTTLISMVIIFFTGTAYGGDSTRLLLSGSKLCSALGAILTPPNVSLRNNIQFHILRLIANIMVIAAYLTAHAESSCFPQEAATQVSDQLLPTLGVSVAAGWALHIALIYDKDTATFPWGGSLTHQQLAAKFGWPSVIISIILLPFLMIWSKLLAFPVWMPFKSGPFYFIKNTLVYPGNEDVMRKKVYTGPTSTARFPAGWNIYADVKGKKLFEKFWGIIQVLDLDVNDDRMIVTPNFMTWLLVSNVYLEFPKAPVFENKARFYFPLKGPNMLNPFCWVTLIFGISGLTWFGKWSFVPFKDEEGVTTIQQMFPPEEDPKNLRPDGSLIYQKGDKKSD